MVTNPTLIVGVLSDSSEAYDRGKKFAHYRVGFDDRFELDLLFASQPPFRVPGRQIIATRLSLGIGLNPDERASEIKREGVERRTHESLKSCDLAGWHVRLVAHRQG